MSVEYNAQSIETLSFRDAVRSRVAMYMGSADNMGVLQCLREIITNSIDEATMGFGKRITVDLYKDNIDISDDEADDIIIEITGLKSINKFIGLEAVANTEPKVAFSLLSAISNLGVVP